MQQKGLSAKATPPPMGLSREEGNGKRKEGAGGGERLSNLQLRLISTYLIFICGTLAGQPRRRRVGVFFFPRT